MYCSIIMWKQKVWQLTLKLLNQNICGQHNSVPPVVAGLSSSSAYTTLKTIQTLFICRSTMTEWPTERYQNSLSSRNSWKPSSSESISYPSTKLVLPYPLYLSTLSFCTFLYACTLSLLCHLWQSLTSGFLLCSLLLTFYIACYIFICKSLWIKVSAKIISNISFSRCHGIMWTSNQPQTQRM